MVTLLKMTLEMSEILKFGLGVIACKPVQHAQIIY